MNDEVSSTWLGRSIHACALGFAVLFCVATIEHTHAFLNGWWTVGTVPLFALVLAVFEDVLWCMIPIAPFCGVAAFKASPSKFRGMFAAGGFMAAFVVLWGLETFVSGFDIYWGWEGMLVFASSLGMVGLSIFVKPIRSFAFGFQVFSGLSFLFVNATAFPFIIMNIVFVVVMPLVGLLLFFAGERLTKKVSMAFLVGFLGLGFVGIAHRTTDSPAHTQSRLESVGDGARMIRDAILERPVLTTCFDETPIEVALGDDRRSVYLVTVDTLRNDHVSKETFPMLFEDGWTRVDPFYSNGTNTYNSMNVMFAGKYGVTNRYLTTLFEAEGYDTFASASIPESLLKEGDGSMLGFQELIEFRTLELDALEYDADGQLLPKTLERIAAAERPTFAWIHFFAPHFPYVESYMEEVERSNRWVSKTLEAIERKDPDAIIVVTSDHGEALGDFGFGTHGWYAWDSIVRIPFFVKGLVVRSKTPRSLVDVGPSILTELGAEFSNFDGCALQSSDCDDPIVLFATKPGNLIGRVEDHHKLIFDLGRDTYHLSKNGRESANLLDVDRERFLRMRQSLHSCERE